MKMRNDLAGTDASPPLDEAAIGRDELAGPLAQLEPPEPPYIRRLRARRDAERTRELEARLRNPWRKSKGREGVLEAWG